MDAVGADQHVERNVRAVVEPHLDIVPPVGEAGEPVAQMNVLVRKSRRDHRQQIATVKRHMRRTVERLAQRVEWRLLECAPVLPAALMRGERAHAVAVEPRTQAKAAQDTHRVRADIDAAADLGQFCSLFINLRLEAGSAQRHGGSKAADTCADDANAKHNDDRLLPWALSYASWPSSEHGSAAFTITRPGSSVSPRSASPGLLLPIPAQRRSDGASACCISASTRLHRD